MELVRFKANLEEFNFNGVTKLRILDRYFKFKRDGKWHRAYISNIDRYRKATYKTFEAIAKHLFRNVRKETRKIPCIVKGDNGERYVTRFLFKDEETLVATELLPKFLKRYSKSEKISVATFYAGDRSMWYEYYDKEESESSNQLLYDIRTLHFYTITNRLNSTQINQFVTRFYPEIFQKEQQLEIRETEDEEEEKSIDEQGKQNIHKEIGKTDNIIETQLEPKIVQQKEEPVTTDFKEEYSPPLEQMESEIKQYKDSIDFQKNFILKAADWKMQESLEKVTDEENRRQLIFTFYKLMKSQIEPAEFYKSINKINNS